jgi:hypothetical protein
VSTLGSSWHLIRLNCSTICANESPWPNTSRSGPGRVCGFCRRVSVSHHQQSCRSERSHSRVWFPVDREIPSLPSQFPISQYQARKRPIPAPSHRRQFGRHVEYRKFSCRVDVSRSASLADVRFAVARWENVCGLIFRCITWHQWMALKGPTPNRFWRIRSRTEGDDRGRMLDMTDQVNRNFLPSISRYIPTGFPGFNQILRTTITE